MLVGNVQFYKGYLSSGIVRDKFDVLCKQSFIGNSRNIKEYKSYYKAMLLVSSNHVQDYCNLAIDEEIEFARAKGETGICIQSDARHNQRKNSYFTDIVFIGKYTRKVLAIYTVFKRNEPVTQRHERLGTEVLIQRMQQIMTEKNFAILNATHDQNASVTNLYRSYGIDVQTDTWHGVRSAIRTIGNKITSRDTPSAIKDQLKTLISKIKTHFYWCCNFCDGDPEVLKKSLVCIASHLMDDHSDCSPNSDCNLPEYEIESPISIESSQFLRKIIEESSLYKKPQEFALNQNTSNVESFNNSVLAFLDKRVRIQEDSYTLRMNLSVLAWNENVGNANEKTYNFIDSLHFASINNMLANEYENDSDNGNDDNDNESDNDNANESDNEVMDEN